MSDRQAIVQFLASVLANSRWEERALVDHLIAIFGKKRRWTTPLVRRLLVRFSSGRPVSREITEWLARDRGFSRARLSWAALDLGAIPPPAMQSALPVTLDVPSIHSIRELANWFGVALGELDWLADSKRFNRRAGTARSDSYHYRILAKRFGTLRLIESPKRRLKAIQRQIHQQIVQHVPAHEAAHGFVRGRSIHSFVAPHIGQAVVARVDLQDFFPSITFARVSAVFRTVGYPENVASMLASVCTNSAPAWVWNNARRLLLADHFRSIPSLYAVPHLPQGAPTSPALANLCAFRLDCRLAGLARSAGAAYTRYADDLAFSGSHDFARHVKRFLVHVGATTADEGFKVHHRKTRIMHASARQHLTGIVVNERPNIRRRDYDALKATLVNCVRHGAEGQNRELHADFRHHLAGRISFVEQVHAERGRRLREIFKRIVW